MATVYYNQSLLIGDYRVESLYFLNQQDLDVAMFYAPENR